METKEDKVREKQVTRYMDIIRGNLEQIDSSLSVLRDNLALVLRDDLVSSDPNKEDERKLVPFVCELRDFHRRMEIILSTINYINEALEL